MAGDWIKMRTSLLTNPKVNGIAKFIEDSTEVSRALTTGYGGVMSEIVKRNVMRHVTVSSLLVVWGAANEHTKDGVFLNSDLADLDDITGIPGFGHAMESVGWAVYSSDYHSVALPNFSEYNTSGSVRSAGAKTAAQRQKEYRDRQKSPKSDVTSDVTVTCDSDRREEKRREDKEVDKSTSKRALKKCPDSFIVPEDLLNAISEECPLVDIDAQTKLFRDYTFKSAKTDWAATWRNWIRTKQERLAEAAAKQPESFKQQDARIGRERWEQMTGEQHPDNAPGQPSNILNVIEISPVKRIGATA